MKNFKARLWSRLIAAIAISSLTAGSEPASKPLILVHYMPWFAADAKAHSWGWHWTMNHFDPSQSTNGHPNIASHYHPLIGPYDSADPIVLEYQLLLMKTAGADGIVVDWYGLSDLFDYQTLHRNTAALFPLAEKVGLKIAVCYEDATIPKLIKEGKLRKVDRVKHARELLDWLEQEWFRQPSYLHWRGRPILLSFGSDGLTDEEWTAVLAPPRKTSLYYFSEHQRRSAAQGAFDWPIPKEGLAASRRFAVDSKSWPLAIPTAFPRFHDIYAEAGVQAGYGRIDDNKGATFRDSLNIALENKPNFIQIATWNDWGEGTMIEPSIEFGYRDLEALQSFRKQNIDPGFQSKPVDLLLADRLLQLRRKNRTDRNQKFGLKLDEVANQVSRGNFESARTSLKALEASRP